MTGLGLEHGRIAILAASIRMQGNGLALFTIMNKTLNFRDTLRGGRPHRGPNAEEIINRLDKGKPGNVTVAVRRCLLGAFLLSGMGPLAVRVRAADGATTGGPASVQIQKADDYFLGRQNLSNVNLGVDLLRSAVAQSPQDYESWWRLAKFYNYWARHASGPENVKLLEEAIEAGKRAVQLQPNRVEGHFWLGASYGLLAEDSGLIDGLRLVDTIRHEMETVIKIDPDYEEASGMRSLARLDYRAPFFKGGDKRKSIQLLEECERRFPDNSLTMLYLADSYIAVGRRAEARALLEKILQFCPDPQYGPELADNQNEARQALTKNFRTGK